MPEKENVQNDNIKVLLVDDEKGFANILTKRLNKRNMDVTPVYTGIEAVQIIRKQDFDVAVLDLKMEDMDGIEVLKIFRKAYPEMAVIMLTGHGSEQAAKEGIEFGAFDYLTKPCELEDLIEKIHEAIAKGR
ncbi:MAG: response regulator [Deltaproteobacteria bacterium]|nr:response regulator [Deltaproteobacteria bacterium]MBW2119553.1 response regulator [Deltaproteobacteria bacterium]MBW2345933.1 response regulator [Deltaproteobacteria bacterium]